MKKNPVITALVTATALSPLALLAIFWTSIPETFLFRFELSGLHEAAKSKNELLISSIIISVVTAAVYWLMRNIKSVDPKVSDQTPKSSFNRVAAALVIFFTALNFYFVLSARYGWIASPNVAFAFFGLLVAALGNYMNTLRPNYFAGIRLPWTLNDPENWRRTHLLASKVWFWGGILMIILCVILPGASLVPLVFIVLAVLVVIPSLYSFSIRKGQS